jgi:formylglycine-generating enzyme required for sulfatase activity
MESMMKIKNVFLTVILAAVLCFSGNLLAACPSMDVTGDCKVNLADFAVFAEQWMTEGTPDPAGMVWVAINDPGIGGGRVGFNGEMSKYETTNAQYCQFLNAALASGDIVVDVNDVLGASGTNTGQDFVGELYYDGDGVGDTNSGAFAGGGAARIHYSGGVFAVDSGFENHPVTYANWYGAVAFCNYYGYRLPTEWEWQAAADYKGNYIYGCGTTIDTNMANYYNTYHPYGTTAVGAYGPYGYELYDTAGNVFEWTSSSFYDYSLGIRCIRGGSWDRADIDCRVSGEGFWGHWFHDAVDATYSIGFRACRGEAPVQSVVPNVIGLTQAQAEAAIAAAGLVVGTLTEEYSESDPAGTIIGQYPYMGQEFLPGWPVDIVVSKGVFIVWVSINDPGVIDHEGFTGEMSKYETTNAQYCHFLNSANAINWITVYNNFVYAASDTSYSQPYYNLAGDGYTYGGATNGGASRINYIDSSFTVDSGFENHPVTFVSWYGSTAFCNYYGYRLPTEWEWQAVADFDGMFNYGCGLSINNNIANYNGSTHTDGTIAVGSFGEPSGYGYGMCDMAANVAEWTSSCRFLDCSGGSRVQRGGSWFNDGDFCGVALRDYTGPGYADFYVGFRVCR